MLPENGCRTAVELAEKTPGKPLAKTAVEPPENRRKTAVELAEKTAGKPLENRREKPRFWVTFASLNKRIGMAGKGLSGVIFPAPGGGCHKETTFQAQSHVLFPSDGVGGTGIYRFLDVTEGLLGPMTAFAEFHEDSSRLKVCTLRPIPLSGGVRTPWLLRKIASIWP